jgi:alpha-L-fucosidase 2
MALHLWEQLTYSMGNDAATAQFLHSTFLPVFRSLLAFYIDYMFEGPDGHMHTGPTTSPENSFRFHRQMPNGAQTQGFQQVALSPAFDMSVLRQV